MALTGEVLERSGGGLDANPYERGEAVATRIHVVIDEVEKERFQREAAREGKSLSAWLREAARARMARREPAELDTVEDLREFFETCDARETEPEPDWEDHRRMIERSARSGAAGT